MDDPERFTLGAVRVASVDSRISVASMVAQAGYGPSRRPRIRYLALERCLQEVARVAALRHATVHMPRIGTGAAGADWAVVRGLIDATLCRSAIPVLVYTLPDSDPSLRSTQQPDLELGR
jgi:hypothetical protein